MGAEVRENGGRWRDPDRDYPEYPPGSVVEIRVHGVGGEPPTIGTRDPHPVQVGGGALAGFHRARDPVVGQLDAGTPGGQRPLHVREVLAWGGQTSGTVRHALWVLLAPFALFNLAGRMHVTSSPERAARHRAVCRVLALTMTLAVVGLTTATTVDLVAVQCASWGEACLGAPGEGRLLLAPLRRFDTDVAGRLGLAAGLPALALVGLWYAGRYGTIQLEGRDRAGRGHVRRRDEPTSLADEDFWRNAWPASRLRGLHATAAFAWVAGVLALAIDQVHRDLGHRASASGIWPVLLIVATVVVAGCLVIAWLPSVATPGPSQRLQRPLAALRLVALGTLGFGIGASLVARLWVDPGGADSTVPTWVWVVVGLVGVGEVLRWTTGTRWVRGSSGRPSTFHLGSSDVPDVSISAANAGLLLGSLAVGAATASLTDGLVVTDAYATPSLGVTPVLPGAFAELDELVPGLFTAPYLPVVVLVLVQLALLVTLAVTSWERTPPRREDASPLDAGPPVVGNQAAVVVALLSLLLVTAVGAGTHALVLDALGDRIAASELGDGGDDVAQLVLPWWYGVTALVVALTPLVAAVGWWIGERGRRRAAPTPAEVAEHLRRAYAATGVEPGPVDDDPRLVAAGRGWLTQRLIRDGGALLAGTVAVLVVAVLVVIGVHARGPSGLGGPLPLVGVATWVVVAVPLAGVALIRRSMRDPEARRGVGRLWDVLTFWPRVTHPFAPPCYAEALVPMLEDRVTRLLPAPDRDPADGGTYRVILAGHSQGSVICLAVAARLAPSAAERGRVALVTYGSPIGILYERYFRAALRDVSGGWLHDRVCGSVHSWHHFLALTEPFAFPFWTVPTGVGDPTPVEDAPSGWRVTRSLPGIHASCEVCDRSGEGRRIERLVADPPVWQLWDGGPVATRGHSVYHADRQVDRHLARIAAALAAPSTAAPVGP